MYHLELVTILPVYTISLKVIAVIITSISTNAFGRWNHNFGSNFETHAHLSVLKYISNTISMRYAQFQKHGKRNFIEFGIVIFVNRTRWFCNV